MNYVYLLAFLHQDNAVGNRSPLCWLVGRLQICGKLEPELGFWNKWTMLLHTMPHLVGGEMVERLDNRASIYFAQTLCSG